MFREGSGEMAGTWTQGFYDSREWLRCRSAFIQTRIATDGGMCQKCHRNIGVIVHHVIPVTPETINDPYVILNHDNLMFLCTSCHNEIHDSTGNNVGFDENGNVINLGQGKGKGSKNWGR